MVWRKNNKHGIWRNSSVFQTSEMRKDTKWAEFRRIFAVFYFRGEDRNRIKIMIIYYKEVYFIIRLDARNGERVEC